MSFVQLTKDLQEYTTIKLHPFVHYISSLTEGITGSMYLYPTRTSRLKEPFEYKRHQKNEPKDKNDTGGAFNEASFGIVNYGLVESISDTVTGLEVDRSNYMTVVNSMPSLRKFNKKFEIERYTPTKTYTKVTSIKNTIRKNLYDKYIHRYPDLGFHYTNYHTINFFDDNDLPSNSCLMYPNYEQKYDLGKTFSVDFWINPRYDNVNKDSHFHASTILHMSSSICLSLVSGSQRDENGLVSSYKLLLQLSQSADTEPSKVNLNEPTQSYPNDLVFTSSNSLTKNHWHHVTVRWSAGNNNNTGSMFIDDNVTRFHIPSSSIYTQNHALILGNYFNNNSDQLKKYFNTSKQTTEGITAISTAGSDEPNNQNLDLTHPAKLELHDFKIFNKYLTKNEIDHLKQYGINKNKIYLSNVQNLYKDLIFYLPPYFIPDSPVRNVVVTPFDTITANTRLPFNRDFSFRMSTRIINLENFTADMSNLDSFAWPRLQSLTSSVLSFYPSGLLDDNFIYSPTFGSKQIRKRNLTILPNDNGLFIPDFYPISASIYSASDAYKKFGDLYDHSKISLENMLPNTSFISRFVPQKGSIYGQLTGLDSRGVPKDITDLYPVAQATKDVSSNEISIFNISNIFYGNKIKEKSIEIIENNLTGSNKKINITVKDNGTGGLYRADGRTKHATWSNLGDVFYHEGLINILSPHLPHFCKDKLDIKFKGDQNIHTMILNVPIYKSFFNSSSNPTFKSNSPTDNINDDNLESIYVSTINIHDNNFNIIMKANFSQPILKTEEDEFVIRLKQDF